jgi:hypothetical protein
MSARLSLLKGFPLSVFDARIEHMFESTALVADRWTPAVDLACDEDYSDLDLAQWVAERWAVEAAGLGEVPYGHGCNEGCDGGCTQPYVSEPSRSVRRPGLVAQPVGVSSFRAA